MSSSPSAPGSPGPSARPSAAHLRSIPSSLSAQENDSPSAGEEGWYDDTPSALEEEVRAILDRNAYPSAGRKTGEKLSPRAEGFLTDGQCPWCGEEVIQFGESFDVALEGHAQECEVFLAEQGGGM
jgi:hypothetical protein